MNLPFRLGRPRRIALAAASFLSLVSVATGAVPDAETNPFARSTFNNDWGLLSNEIFFGGVEGLFGLSPAGRTFLLTETTASKAAAHRSPLVNVASENENVFSFASFGSPFARSAGGSIAPTAPTAVIEWANVGPTFSDNANWVGGAAPANSTTTDIGSFGSTGGSPVNPNLTAGRSINGLSFLSGAFAYTIDSSTGSALLIGTGGITNSATNTETFGSGIILRTSASQTWTNNGGPLIFNGVVDINQNNPGGARTLTVDGSGNTTFNGVIQNSALGSTGNLVKSGTGTLTLTGTNTYTGLTTVTGSGSVLLINGNNSAATGAVNVNSGGTTLGGSGTTGGAVTVASGSNLSPGPTGAGTTAVFGTGALTLNSGSFFNVDLNGTTVGSGYDQVSVTGTVSIGGSNLGVTVGGTFALGDKFFITLNDGTDLVTGTFAQVGTVTANNGYVFLINYLDNGDGGLVGNDISLTLTAIPEPSTWIGAALALAAIGFTQRRRFHGLLARHA